MQVQSTNTSNSISSKNHKCSWQRLTELFIHV